MIIKWEIMQGLEKLGTKNEFKTDSPNIILPKLY